MRRCPLCGAAWEKYAGSSTCLFCGDREDGGFRCPGGHYVCETCRADDPRDFTMRVCERSSERSPLVLWDLITAHPAFAGHGPQYHFVVFPILAGVLRNRGLLILEPEAIARGIGSVPLKEGPGAIQTRLRKQQPERPDPQEFLAMASGQKKKSGITQEDTADRGSDHQGKRSVNFLDQKSRQKERHFFGNRQA